jgi:ankyrin repeat protein
MMMMMMDEALELLAADESPSVPPRGSSANSQLLRAAAAGNSFRCIELLTPGAVSAAAAAAAAAPPSTAAAASMTPTKTASVTTMATTTAAATMESKAATQQHKTQQQQPVAQINCQSAAASGATPLMLACRNNRLETAALLLHYRADIEARDASTGATSFMHAVQERNYALCVLMIENTCDVNATDKYANTALNVAAARKSGDLCKALLQAGALVNHRNADDCTALIDAATCGHTETVRCLLAHRADANVVIEHGYTALIRAARNGYNISCALLIDGGNADIHARTRNDNRTALHWAATEGWRDTVVTLLERGASVTALDSEGHTAHECAKARNQTLATGALLEWMNRAARTFVTATRATYKRQPARVKGGHFTASPLFDHNLIDEIASYVQYT